MIKLTIFLSHPILLYSKFNRFTTSTLCSQLHCFALLCIATVAACRLRALIHYFFSFFPQSTRFMNFTNFCGCWFFFGTIENAKSRTRFSQCVPIHLAATVLTTESWFRYIIMHATHTAVTSCDYILSADGCSNFPFNLCVQRTNGCVASWQPSALRSLTKFVRFEHVRVQLHMLKAIKTDLRMK